VSNTLQLVKELTCKKKNYLEGSFAMTLRKQNIVRPRGFNPQSEKATMLLVPAWKWGKN